MPRGTDRAARSGAAPGFGPKRLAHWFDDSGRHRVTELLLDPLVDVDEVFRTGRALELRRALLPVRVEADFQRVPVDLVDAQHDRPLVRALGHGHIDSLRRLGRVEFLCADLDHLVTLLDGVLMALKSKDEPLQLADRKLLAARF